MTMLFLNGQVIQINDTHHNIVLDDFALIIAPRSMGSAKMKCSLAVNFHNFRKKKCTNFASMSG